MTWGDVEVEEGRSGGRVLEDYALAGGIGYAVDGDVVEGFHYFFFGHGGVGLGA